MLNRAGKRDNHISDDGSSDREDDRGTVSRGPATAAGPVESWMPAWWQLAGGFVVFGVIGLGLASLGGVVGVVLILVLLAAAIWLLSRWASWE